MTLVERVGRQHRLRQRIVSETEHDDEIERVASVDIFGFCQRFSGALTTRGRVCCTRGSAARVWWLSL